MSKIITLAFLEQRTYLQGTTLFDYLSNNFGLEKNIIFKVNHKIESNQVIISDKPSDLANASIFWQENKENKALYISAIASKNIIRERFDEQAIINNAIFAPNSVTSTVLSHESSIRTLVALNKELHKRTIPINTAGQWLFTRLDCSENPNNYKKFEIKLINYTKINLTLANIYVIEAETESKKLLGRLYFSWLAK